MKKLFKYFYVLICALLIISCDSDSDVIITYQTVPDPAPPQINYNPNKFHTVRGAVYDYVYTDTSPFEKKDVPVVLDNDTVRSDAHGYYIFSKVKEGIHNISISLPNYEPFAKTISVPPDTMLRINVFHVKEDYFPIQENSQKKFKYYDYWTNNISTSRTRGIAIWNISSSKMVNDTRVYSILETLVDTSTSSGSGGINTTYDTVKTNFEITVDNSNNINIKLSIINGLSFNRYQNPLQGEIVTITQNGGTTRSVSLKKNVGLYKISTNGFRGIETTYQLIE
jgi:hypothetical protein